MKSSYGALEKGVRYDSQDEDDDSINETQRSPTSSKMIAVTGIATLMSLVGAMAVFSDPTKLRMALTHSVSNLKARSSPTQRAPVKMSNDLAIAASDEYGDTSATKFPYPFLEDALLASPYKNTTFDVTNTMSGCKYTWSITDPNGNEIDSGESSDGSFSTTIFKTVGQYSLSIAESDCDDPDFTRSIDKTVWVKYVRRELSTLTDADREAFLDAFSTLWKVNTVDGKALYGDKYKSLYYLATIHNDAGANSACDEFHGDQGFVNNHLMLGAYLEQSMQLVDPSTCLHYMEYAMYFESSGFEDHMKNQLDGGAWTELLTDKWFGSNDPFTGRIVDSRWENASVPRMDSQFFVDHGVDPDNIFFPSEERAWKRATDMIHMRNPYGLLRSPWNWNPNPYVARYNNVNMIQNLSTIKGYFRDFYSGVKCIDMQEFIENSVVGKPLSNFLQNAEDNTHGKIHFTFGGAGGDFAYETNKIMAEKYNITDEYFLLIALGEQTFVKKAYPTYEDRNKYGYPYPFNCTTFPWVEENQTLWTTDIPGEPNALCTLNPYYCETQDHMDLFYKKYLAAFQTTNQPQYDLEALLLTYDLDTQCDAANMLVSRAGYDGEMAGSGAAMDPLFWVAHGTVERLLQKVIFANVTTSNDYDSTTAFCSGHKNEGTKYWLTGYYFVNTSIVAEDLTNVELNVFLNPTSDEYRDNFNFVYDTSSYSYCESSTSWFLE